jgi:hypothetical protein
LGSNAGSHGLTQSYPECHQVAPPQWMRNPFYAVFQEKEYEFQIGTLQNQISDKESMCEYASQKLDIHIGKYIINNKPHLWCNG